ncbi:type II toxin-antitoxin system RelE/ParE family toxin [Paracoccus yeei]|uniref:Toxin n=1 Tax=Paracoccus yeei TaxID=147645 RepID=A0A2D2C071_9RHOB|nr:type II toxin-antitoxin system RelE/ParE family toxin [Paracoccus yeei]ATQ55892.1 plasmid stabilization protein ParE [Paracoccus yeei]
MTTKAWRLSPLAEDDLEGIWLYTMRHWSVAQADNYYRQLVAEIEALAAGRTRGRSCTVRAGYLKRSCGSHVIFFRDLGNTLDIVRILHGAQDAERHL